MADVVTGAPEGAAEEIAIPSHKAAGDGELTVRDAVNSLTDWRRKNAAAQAADAPEKDAPAEESTAKADDTDPPKEVPGETQEAEPAELPPIDPPRSWTKAEKEEFATYPREAQEKIARREQERDAATRRSQNEAAEKLKGLTAKEQAVEQARQQYESALPILLQNLQAAMSGEFSDIKSMADVDRMAAEDWPRYIRWDAQQKKMAVVQQEIQAANNRQVQEKSQKWDEFSKREDDLFAEKVPEMADEAKAAKLRTSAISVLKDLGFEDSELAQSWNGQKDLSLRDHRVQLLIRDASLWREAQQAKKQIQAKAKPVPPVQRPGTSSARMPDAEANIRDLQKRLNETGDWRVAAQLTKAKREAAAR